MLKHCAASRKRQLSALPNVGPYMYDISRLRVKDVVDKVFSKGLLWIGVSLLKNQKLGL
jgi:hypothetical protein